MALTAANNFVTDYNLVKLAGDLSDATLNLRLACLSLRSCYVINASSVPEFIKLRRRVTNHATVYRKTVLPIANIVIQSIQDFIETYTVLDYDTFEECIEDLAADAKMHHEIAAYVKILHQELLSGLKSEENNVNIVLKKFERDAKFYEAQAKALRESANSKWNWAIFLSLIPVLNILAAPILWKQSNKHLMESIAEEEESKLAVATALVIRDVLSTALHNFIKALANVSGFFNILQNELSLLARNHDDRAKKIHYKKCKNKAQFVINSCRSYMRQIPECEADLQSIPTDFDKNYVQQWLAEKKTEIGDEQISLLEMGKTLFKSNKKFLRLY